MPFTTARACCQPELLLRSACVKKSGATVPERCSEIRSDASSIPIKVARRAT